MNAERFLVAILLAVGCSGPEVPTLTPQTVVLAGPSSYYQITLDLPPGSYLETSGVGSTPGLGVSTRRSLPGTSARWFGAEVAIELAVDWESARPRRRCATGATLETRLDAEGGHVEVCLLPTGEAVAARYWRSEHTEISCAAVDGYAVDVTRVRAWCAGMRIVKENIPTEPERAVSVPLFDETGRRYMVEIRVPRHHEFYYPYRCLAGDRIGSWADAWVMGFHGPLVRLQLLEQRPTAALMDCPIRPVGGEPLAVDDGHHECSDAEYFQLERYVQIRNRYIQCTIHDRVGEFRKERDHLRAICASMRVVEAS